MPSVIELASALQVAGDRETARADYDADYVSGKTSSTDNSGGKGLASVMSEQLIYLSDMDMETDFILTKAAYINNLMAYQIGNKRYYHARP